MNKVYFLAGVSLLFLLTAFWWKKEENKESKPKELTELILPEEEKVKSVGAMENHYEIGAPELSVRDHKVLQKLMEFEKKTSYITAERIALERERISKKLKQIENQEALTPEKKIIVDEQGEAWEKIDYGQGIIRYNFAEEHHSP